MKALFCLVVLLAANAARGQTPGIKHPPNHSIISSDRLHVRAAIDPATVKAGTPIVVKLISKNIWYNVVTVADNSTDIDYELIVVDSSGKELTRTPYGDGLFRGEYVLLHTGVSYLEPGQEIRAEIEVTKIYQVTQPGTYYMWATRDALPGSPDEPKLTVDPSKLPIERAFSNAVKFAVVP
jgi:hypothetical protein